MSTDLTDRHSFDRLRHRWEMPMIAVSLALTLLGLGLGLAILSIDEAVLREQWGEDAEMITEVASYGALVLVAPLVIYVIRFWLAAKLRSNSIRIGPRQFPEIWDRYVALGEKLGMTRLPALYVANGNGVVNAYALSCNTRRNYVVLHAEIAHLVDRSPQMVEFVMAHELAHHKLRHVALWRQVIAIIPNLLQLPGHATSRAQEYSADRVAMAVCPGCSHGAGILAVGPFMEGAVNPDAWLEQCHDEARAPMIRMVNAMSSHAVLTKRYKALRAIEDEGFTVHGEMF